MIFPATAGSVARPPGNPWRVVNAHTKHHSVRAWCGRQGPTGWSWTGRAIPACHRAGWRQRSSPLLQWPHTKSQSEWWSWHENTGWDHAIMPHGCHGLLIYLLKSWSNRKQQVRVPSAKISLLSLGGQNLCGFILKDMVAQIWSLRLWLLLPSGKLTVFYGKRP